MYISIVANQSELPRPVCGTCHGAAVPGKAFTMLDILWGIMILAGIIYAVFSGRIEAVGNGALDSATEAVSLCITMLGIMALWTGLMQIAKKAGIIEKLTLLLQPLLTLLFPEIPKGHIALEYIAGNMIANVLGLGWASTPVGLLAMKELAKLNRAGNSGEEAPPASDAMCTFLVINISSLQLIPISIIAYRSEYGSTDPAGITMAAVIATSVSTAAGIFFCLAAKKFGKKP